MNRILNKLNRDNKRVLNLLAKNFKYQDQKITEDVLLKLINKWKGFNSLSFIWVNKGDIFNISILVDEKEFILFSKKPGDDEMKQFVADSFYKILKAYGLKFEE